MPIVKDRLTWPELSYIVLKNHKVVFCPIAKNACTSLKMFALSFCYNNGACNIKPGLVHTYLSENITGLTLKDYNVSEAKHMLFDDEYFRFIILRNPYVRLVSAYLQKFVMYRGSVPPEGHYKPLDNTVDAIKWVYRNYGGEPDFKKSIVFREFITYLANNTDDKLDTHWISQISYFSNIKFDYIGRVEDLRGLEAVLAARRGLDIKIDHLNKTPNEEIGSDISHPYDLYPEELEALDRLPSANDMLQHELKLLIRKRYKVDFELYEKRFNEILG